MYKFLYTVFLFFLCHPACCFVIRLDISVIPGLTGDLDVEEEMHNVAVLDDIVLAFDTEFSGGAAGSL